MSGIIGKIPSRSRIVESLATVEQGGTGVSTFTDGGILLGSGSGAITATAELADGEMLVGDGTTDPAIESGGTLRTSIGLGNVDNIADASQTSVGTITSGTWQGTTVAVNQGGTGATTHTANNVMIGAGTSALTSIAPGADGQVLTSTGTVWNSEAVASAGITAASQWKLDAAVSTASADLTAWVEVASTRIGTVMSEDSAGVFQFPETGHWLITFVFNIETTTGRGNCRGHLQTTTDYTTGPTWTTRAEGLQCVVGDFTYNYTNSSMSYIFNVTSTTANRVKFNIGTTYPSTAVTFLGSANNNQTYVTFIRLGD